MKKSAYKSREIFLHKSKAAKVLTGLKIAKMCNYNQVLHKIPFKVIPPF